MATWRVNNSTLLGGEVCAQWQASHAYSLGARCVCTTAYATTARRAWVWECTTAGTSGSTEPAWPTSGTVNDGGVVWTQRNPNDGSWDNASCILHYVLNHTTITTGDVVYVDDGHNEAVLLGATAVYIVKGSASRSNPLRILCVDKATDTLSTGAIVYDQQTSTYYPTRFQDNGYAYGIKFTSGKRMAIYSDAQWNFESNNTTVFAIASGGFLSVIYDNSLCIIRNANIEFIDSTAHIMSNDAPGYFGWFGGSVVAPKGVASLIKTSFNQAVQAEICNVNLNPVGNNILFDNSNGAYVCDILFSRCKLPSSPTILSGTINNFADSKIRLHHCSSSNAAYDFYEECYYGTVQDETTIVRTGGASDGVTGISHKMVSSAGTVEFAPSSALGSPPITTWNTATSSKTFTIEVVHDSATALQNDEIWVELEYPADNSSGLGAVASSQCAQLGTPADIPDSSASWTTTGMTNPNTRKLSVTVTPGKAGPVTAKVYLAKASTTVYVDPLITIT